LGDKGKEGEMKKAKNENVRIILKKMNKAKKWRAKQIAKNILVTIWTITIFPLILFWMFLTDDRR
jgi:hypothetical protein